MTPIDLAGATLTGGTSLTVTDYTNNKIFQQTSGGYVMQPQNSSSSTLIPLFNVGAGSGGWSAWTANVWSLVAHTYTSGSGYYNVGGCYNTGNSAFTAPFTGLYIFKSHMYIYEPSGNIDKYVHPQLYINGSATTRRNTTPYRIRLYGMYSNYGYDTDFSEIVYLTAGDYAQIYVYSGNGSQQYYQQYSCWSGSYLGG